MAEWQTRCLEGAVGVYLCGFKSRRPHKYRKRDKITFYGTMILSLLFCILMILLDERPKDFHNSNNKTAGLLPSSCYYVKSIKNYITNDRQSPLLFYQNLQNITHNDFSHQQMDIFHHIIILHSLLSIVLLYAK